MKNLLYIFSILLLLTSCKAKKVKSAPKRKVVKTEIPASVAPKVEAILRHAKSYEGTPYKYGGTTSRGMDCSGLIYTAFSKENQSIPRTSTAMSTYGDWVDLKTVQPGDLLFFATQKNSRKINHVGLVVASRTGEVSFMHSTTSRGVITSQLSEKYWYFAFVQARRVL